jgi:hypothetical protein
MSTKMPFAFVGTPTATTQQLGRCLYTLNSIGLVLSKMELGDLVSLCRVSTRACARARIRTVKCCDCSFQHHCDDPLGEIGSDDTRGNGPYFFNGVTDGRRVTRDDDCDDREVRWRVRTNRTEATEASCQLGLLFSVGFVLICSERKRQNTKTEDADHGDPRRRFAPFEYVRTVQCHWSASPRM